MEDKELDLDMLKSAWKDGSPTVLRLIKEVERLRDEVRHAYELGHANVHWKDKEIEKLEKENAKMKEWKVKASNELSVEKLMKITQKENTKLREINKNLMRNIGRNG